MAEIKSNPVIYSCDAEGRDAFWSALRNFNRKSIALTKRSRPEQVFCDSSQYEYQCNDVNNEHKNNSDESLVVSPPQTPVTPDTPDKTAEGERSTYATATATPTTPSPPPPLQSPPPLEHRSAGQRRRRSSAHPDDWAAARSAVYRLRSRASISAITWLDDFATAAADGCGDARPCKSCDDDDDDDGGGGIDDGATDAAERAPVSRPVAEEVEPAADRRGADGNGDSSSLGSTAGQPIVVVVDEDDDDGQAGITPLQLQAPRWSEHVGDVDDVDDDEPTLMNYDDDEPTLVDDDRRDQRPHDDSAAGVNQLCNVANSDNPIAMSDYKPLSEYDMKVKEVDENIAFYTKRFMCTIMFFILLRVFY